jgi:hypothetical protein
MSRDHPGAARSGVFQQKDMTARGMASLRTKAPRLTSLTSLRGVILIPTPGLRGSVPASASYQHGNIVAG